jgi:hypothetical protein
LPARRDDTGADIRLATGREFRGADRPAGQRTGQKPTGTVF